MRLKIDEPELVTEFMAEYGDKSSDFKALVLRLVVKMKNVEKVSTLTGVPISTIYDWIVTQ
jgi:ABC-type taurine transport system substrate-binding protein